MLPKMFHPPIQLRNNLARHRHFRGMRLKIIPQFGHKNEPLGRRKFLELRILLKIASAQVLATPGFRASGAPCADFWATRLLKKTPVPRIDRDDFITISAIENPEPVFHSADSTSSN